MSATPSAEPSSWWESVGAWFANGWHTVLGWSAQLEETLVALTDSPLIYLGVGAVSLLDAIFPIVPSESVVITAAAASAATGTPILILVWVAAVVGAWLGDQITYTIGQLVDVRRVPLLRGERGHKTVAWAEHALEHRGTSFIIAARFIPMGRIAVNLMAGALRYPRRRFMVIDLIAVSIWATYAVTLGALAGNFLDNNLLLGIVLGVAGGIALGYLVDFILKRFGIKPPDLPDFDQLPEGETPRQAARASRAARKAEHRADAAAVGDAER